MHATVRGGRRQWSAVVGDPPASRCASRCRRSCDLGDGVTVAAHPPGGRGHDPARQHRSDLAGTPVGEFKDVGGDDGIADAVFESQTKMFDHGVLFPLHCVGWRGRNLTGSRGSVRGRMVGGATASRAAALRRKVRIDLLRNLPAEPVACQSRRSAVEDRAISPAASSPRQHGRTDLDS